MMTLREDATRARDCFDSTDASEFLDVISRVRDRLNTEQTRQYLDGKIQAARNADPDKRQALCKNLLPYLEWYLCGG